MSRHAPARMLATVAAGATLAVSTLVGTAQGADLERTASSPGSTAVIDGTAGPDRTQAFHETRPIGPGMELVRTDSFGPDGYSGLEDWRRSHVLSVDLTQGVEVDRVFPGQVAATSPLSEMVTSTGAVAAVNADYFDIAGSGAPWGVGVQSGELLHSPLPNTRADTMENAVVFDEDSLGAIGEVLFEGSIDLPDGTETSIDALNKAELLDGQIALFTSAWGEYCRCRATEAATETFEVFVTGGQVTEVSTEVGAGQIADDSVVLVGREEGAHALSTLDVGDRVSFDYSVRGPADMQMKAAMSGRQVLVTDGVPQQLPAENNTSEPRTAVGLSADGSQMWLVAVDGRQPGLSAGIGLDELAQVMVDLGAHSALNLDGGGSTTLVAREPGSNDGLLVNSPSDGAERPVPTGLAMYIPEGSGELDGFWLRPRPAPDHHAAYDEGVLLRTDHVFPGLRRTFIADAHDETYGPADQSLPWHWRSDDARVGITDRSGVFTAHSSGSASITLRSGRVHEQIDVTVAGDLEHVLSVPAQVDILDLDNGATFDLIGMDNDGLAAPIEAEDIDLDYDESMIDVSSDEHGRLVVNAVADRGATVMTATVLDIDVEIPVGIGLDEIVVADFDDAEDWELLEIRAVGELSRTEAGWQGPGLQLTYDFTADDGTRGIGAWTPGRALEVPGEPREFRMWVNSEGLGERARLEVHDAHGTLLPSLEYGFLEEAGWKQLTFPVPEGVEYPLSVWRFYFNQLDLDEQYHSEIRVDELTALVPQDLELGDP